MYMKMLIMFQVKKKKEKNQQIKLVNTLNLLIKSLFSFSNQQTCKGYSILCFGSVYWDSAWSSLVLLLQETNVKYKNTISYSFLQNGLFCLLIIIHSEWILSFLLAIISVRSDPQESEPVYINISQMRNDRGIQIS